MKVHADAQPHILKDALGISYDQFTFPRNVKLSGKLYGAESLDDFARSADADINSDDADSAEVGKPGALWNFSNRKAQRCLQDMNIITGKDMLQ